MTDRIILSFRLADIDEVGTVQRLQRRFFGWSPIWLVLLVALASGAITTVVAVKVFDNPARPVFAGMVAGVVAYYFSHFVNQAFTMRLQRAVLAAPFRQEEVEVVLGPDGAFRTQSLLPWRWITEVVEEENMTLLLLSPTEFLPLPHSRLQGGVTPAQMRAAIAAWRKAAEVAD
jgi:hypothetical protein